MSVDLERMGTDPISISEYGDKSVKFVFRHFPLQQHKNAVIAAETAEAAGAQGKYWEMHNLLYERQEEWSEHADPLALFVTYAQQLNLNTDQFVKEMADHKYASIVQTNSAEGQRVSVHSTPTIFMNGQLMKDFSPQSLRDKIIALLVE